MSNWVYKAIFIGKDNVDLIRVNKILNAYSEWDLVAVDNGIAYFKRPYEEVKKNALDYFGKSSLDDKE